uniref:NAD-dependent epimerase/dehydratase domain-containing protein n=3 Tax=Ditylum brightwellii TaxID=49249 RepID=A0A6U3VJR2_9STRA|mmetsp:Transcript_8295/g.12388  ORF Transcript_8295/g.12388 Transcript_8295/m.12388 type:complete len:405 (+) Transcript_8295:89-1303(+)
MLGSTRLLGAVSSNTVRRLAHRSLSTTPNPVSQSLYRRENEVGPGGRCSNAGVKVAVFGGGGFLGRYVCCNLGTHGTLTYIANRGDDMELRHLKPSFDLGRSRFVFYSPRDRESMKEVIADADIVINMVGKYYETKALSNKEGFPYLEYKTNFSFEECNVDICRTVAELCTEMQVDNLIHVSSAAASPDSGSEWARTKFLGEQAVKEAFPWATIIRPTQLFGPEDRFLNWFANAANMYPAVPLVDGGNALTQPVYTTDVADTIMRVVDDPEEYEGKTIDCFGPADYTYKELSEFVFDITNQDPTVAEVPKSVMLASAKLMQYQPLPMVTPDLVELWSEDYLPPVGTQEDYDAQTGKDKILTMKDLGVAQTPIEKIAFNYLHRFRKGGHFALAGGYHGNHTEKSA